MLDQNVWKEDRDTYQKQRSPSTCQRLQTYGIISPTGQWKELDMSSPLGENISDSSVIMATRILHLNSHSGGRNDAFIILCTQLSSLQPHPPILPPFPALSLSSALTVLSGDQGVGLNENVIDQKMDQSSVFYTKLNNSIKPRKETQKTNTLVKKK